MSKFTQLMVLSLLVATIGMVDVAQQDICPDGANYWPDMDCHFYYDCRSEPPIHQECPPGLYWNQELTACDYPENVPDCVGGTRPPIGTPPTTTAAPDTTTTTTTGPSTTTESSGCPPEGVHFIPHPELCHAYYICVEGEQTEPYHECPDGFYFDPSIGECNFASEVDCEYGTTTTATPTTTTEGPLSSTTTTPRPTTGNPITDCPPDGEHLLPYPGDCSIYTKCFQGFPILLRCPVGTLFDTWERICKPEDEAVCDVRKIESLFNFI